MKKIDDFAVETIPTRLIVTIAIISVIALLVFFGYKSFSVTNSENQVETYCKELESKLASMLASGETRDIDEVDASMGTIRSQSFTLPDNILFLSFGVDPDPDNAGGLETGLTGEGNVIFYRVEGGNKKSVWLNEDFKFREGLYKNDKWTINEENEGFIINDSGKITLSFEYIEKNGERFILIHANDSI